MLLGAHESIAGGVHKAIPLAREDGCESIQIFVKSPNRFQGKPLTHEEIEGVKASFKNDFPPSRWTVHAGYLINLGSPEKTSWERSYENFKDEYLRTRALGIPTFILHPGSHKGKGVKEGLKRVATAINRLHDEVGAGSPIVLLETMPGAGDQLCSRFDEIARILELLDHPEAVGVCADTCHLFVAGIPLSPASAYERTLAEMEDAFSLRRLMVWHLNDAKGEFGSRKDRHEHIGKGRIPLEVFELLLNDPRWDGTLGILETPELGEERGYRENLATLRSLIRRGLLQEEKSAKEKGVVQEKKER